MRKLQIGDVVEVELTVTSANERTFRGRYGDTEVALPIASVVTQIPNRDRLKIGMMVCDVVTGQRGELMGFGDDYAWVKWGPGRHRVMPLRGLDFAA